MRISDWSSDVCSSDLSNSARFLANFSAARASSPHISNCHNSSSWAAFHIVSASAAPSSQAKDATTDPVKETIGDKPASMNGEWLRSEEHTSEIQSLMRIPYAVFCFKKKNMNEHPTP